MPAWIIDLAISLAMKFGVPWVLSKLPWLPKNLGEIIQELIDAVKNGNTVKKAAVRKARVRIKKEVLGIGSATDTKGLE